MDFAHLTLDIIVVLLLVKPEIIRWKHKIKAWLENRKLAKFMENYEYDPQNSEFKKKH